MYKRQFHHSSFENENRNENDQDVYLQLRRWVPSEFITTLFVSFSPLCLVFLYLSVVSFITIVPVIFHQVFLHYLILNCYKYALRDNAIISEVTMDEYVTNYVTPKNSVKYQDVLVDSTPDGAGYVQFSPALSSIRSPIFKTHSLKGEVINERFDYNKNEFEDFDNGINEKTHNIIRTPHLSRFSGK